MRVREGWMREVRKRESMCERKRESRDEQNGRRMNSRDGKER